MEDQAAPWNALNPTQMTPQCPVILAHGEDDVDVPIAMSRACAETYTRRGFGADLMPLPGDHYTIIDASHESWRRIQEVILVWLMSGEGAGHQQT